MKKSRSKKRRARRDGGLISVLLSLFSPAMQGSLFHMIFISNIILSLFPVSLAAESFNLNFKGFISSWASASAQKAVPSQIGLRWLPALTLTKSFSREKLIEAEFSLNAWTAASFSHVDDSTTQGRLKLYRGHGRYSSSRFEARLGLQKISFGSAAFLRPLMWFDRLDPRDPLQITDGVYGLLVRYFFLNNTNIWLWGLYGNDKPKGWEILGSARKKPEFGGRLQLPLGKGEIGFSFHHRQARLDEKNKAANDLFSESNFAGSVIPEYRLGLDGKWDLGVGVWFEAAFIHQADEFLTANRQRALAFGLDYTFALGRGLYALTEYFELSAGKDAWSGVDKVRLAVFSLSYPLSLLDNLMAVGYHDGQNGDTYLFFRWQRTYDRWNFHLMGFWNPERFAVYRMPDSSTTHLFAGKGIQLMVVFHY